jgi:hypothetical protein
MLVPRELDPVAAGARMPLPPLKPAPPPEPKAATRPAVSSAVQSHATQPRRPMRGLQNGPKPSGTKPTMAEPGEGWTMRSR